MSDADAVIDALVVYVFVKDTEIVPVAEELGDAERVRVTVTVTLAQPEYDAVTLSDFRDAVAHPDASVERDGDVVGEDDVENDRVVVPETLGEPDAEPEARVDTLSVAVETDVLDALSDDESEGVPLPVSDPDPLRVPEGVTEPVEVSEYDTVPVGLTDVVLVIEIVPEMVYEPVDEPVDEGVALRDPIDAVAEAVDVIDVVEDVVTVAETKEVTD